MTYKHKATGNLYVVILAGEMKTPEGWKLCVIYTDLSGRIYVREKDSFYMKFEAVHN